jgi:pentachlorophenol monooxygenase
LRGTHHTLLVYGATPTELHGLGASGDAVGALRQRCGDQLKAYVIVAPDAAGRGGDVCPTLVDSGGHFQRAYAAAGATAYLVRPDGYVGFRTDALRLDTLGQYLGSIFR